MTVVEKGEALITVIDGVEGMAVYVNEHRVAGPKPWGGGSIVGEWKVLLTEVDEALEPSRPAKNGIK